MNTTGRKTVKGRTTSAPKKIEKASATKERTSNEPSEATAEIAADSQSSAASVKPAPTREQIALRAYQINRARGSHPGHEAEYWLAAEAELSV